MRQLRRRREVASNWSRLDRLWSGLWLLSGVLSESLVDLSAWAGRDLGLGRVAVDLVSHGPSAGFEVLDFLQLLVAFSYAQMCSLLMQVIHKLILANGLGEFLEEAKESANNASIDSGACNEQPLHVAVSMVTVLSVVTMMSMSAMMSSSTAVVLSSTTSAVFAAMMAFSVSATVMAFSMFVVLAAIVMSVSVQLAAGRSVTLVWSITRLAQVTSSMALGLVAGLLGKH